jgi:hypothetical protein
MRWEEGNKKCERENTKLKQCACIYIYIYIYIYIERERERERGGGTSIELLMNITLEWPPLLDNF